MSERQKFAYLLVLLLVAALLNALGGAVGVASSTPTIALLASVLLLIIIGLLCSEFLANIDWPELHAAERIRHKEMELRHGRQHLLREIQKQLGVLKQMSEKRHEYHDELLKELAILTRQLQ